MGHIEPVVRLQWKEGRGPGRRWRPMRRWAEGGLTKQTDVRHTQVKHFLAAIQRAAREQRRWRERNLRRPWWSAEAGVGGVGGGMRGITFFGRRGGSETEEVKQILAASKRSEGSAVVARAQPAAISVSSEAGDRGVCCDQWVRATVMRRGRGQMSETEDVKQILATNHRGEAVGRGQPVATSKEC